MTVAPFDSFSIAPEDLYPAFPPNLRDPIFCRDRPNRRRSHRLRYCPYARPQPQLSLTHVDPQCIEQRVEMVRPEVRPSAQALEACLASPMPHTAWCKLISACLTSGRMFLHGLFSIRSLTRSSLSPADPGGE